MTKIQSCHSILQITDLHIPQNPGTTLAGINTEYFFHAILKQAFASHPHFDLVLLTGDLAQDPCEESYQRVMSALEAYKTPCIGLPGNHDSFELMNELFTSSIISCNRQFTFENWQIICLNSVIPFSDKGHLSEDELSHLKQYLDNYPDHHALIAVHHHCIKTKSTWMDTMMIDNSDELLLLIKQYDQVKAITFGHIHQALDVSLDSIRFLGTPSTCFQFKPGCRTFTLDNLSPGYRVLRLYDDGRLESEMFRLSESLTGLQTDFHGY